MSILFRLVQFSQYFAPSCEHRAFRVCTWISSFSSHRLHIWDRSSLTGGTTMLPLNSTPALYTLVPLCSTATVNQFSRLILSTMTFTPNPGFREWSWARTISAAAINLFSKDAFFNFVSLLWKQKVRIDLYYVPLSCTHNNAANNLKEHSRRSLDSFYEVSLNDCENFFCSLSAFMDFNQPLPQRFDSDNFNQYATYTEPASLLQTLLMSAPTAYRRIGKFLIGVLPALDLNTCRMQSEYLHANQK